MNQQEKNEINGEKLQTLLERNYDAREGFKQAMEDTHNHDLKRFLFAKAIQRGEFIAELENQLDSLHEKAQKEGTISGTVHRAWIDLKTTLAGKEDVEVLEECLRGEKVILEEYQETLKKENFPGELAAVLQKQMLEIQKTLDEIKSLEDLEERKWDADKAFSSKI
ncbi:PA2169 family four-helix-bundle protein [Zunongwangia sp. H14]|uniref:ferritin-like domain-containing protein n=1 Tax=Zunongwangia sp. H14 TaxID=3240792 RepID=UPI0035646E48